MANKGGNKGGGSKGGNKGQGGGTTPGSSGSASSYTQAQIAAERAKAAARAAAKQQQKGQPSPVVTKEAQKGTPTVITEAPVTEVAPSQPETGAPFSGEEYRARTGPFSSTEGLVRVDPQYAQNHPEAVIELEPGQYYRPVTGPGTAFLSSEERAKLEAETLEQIKKGEVGFGSLGGGAAGWSQGPVLQAAMEVLEPYTKRQGDNLLYDIPAIALSDDANVQKAAQKLFPDLNIGEIRQEFEAVEEQNPQLYQILTEQGYRAYMKAYDSAINALERYEVKTEDGTSGGYDIVGLAISEDQRAKKAAMLVLPGVTSEYLNTLREEYKGATQLPDGVWMSQEDLNSLTPEMRDIALNSGYAALQSQVEKALAAMEPYKEGAYYQYEPPQGELTKEEYEEILPSPSYKLIDAVQEGKVDEKYLNLLFGEEAVEETKEWLRDYGYIYPSLSPMPTSGGETAARGIYQITGTGQEFAERYPEFCKEITSIMGGGSVVNLQDYYGRYYDAYFTAKQELGADANLPSLEAYLQNLNDQVTDYAKYIGTLSKDNPERQIYDSAVQRRAITAASIVAAAVAPAITPAVWGGIGAAGARMVPAVISKTPLLSWTIGLVPRIASSLATTLARVGFATASTASVVYPSAVVAESLQAGNLQRRWEVFAALPADERNGWAKVAGYNKVFDNLTDSEKAAVLLQYSVPPGYTISEWSRTIQEYSDKLVEYAGKGADWLQEHAPAPIAMPISFAGGAVVGVAEGLGYTAQLPLIAANLVDKVPEGKAKDFAAEIAAGMALFFTTTIPQAVKENPALASGRLTGMFLLSPAALAKFAKGVGYNLNPTTIKGWGKAIAIEFSTVKVRASRFAGLTKAQMLEIGRTLVEQLQRGKAEAEVRVGDIVIKVRNVPYQRAVGNTYFHFSSDIAKHFPRGEPIKIGSERLHLSPHGAERFAEMSASGEKMTHPGLVQVIVSPKYNPTLYKILRQFGKGVEMETALKNVTLDPIPGRAGRGTGFSWRLGSYPIQRYVIRGEGGAWKGLTPKQLAKIYALTAKEAALDLVAGWQGRWEALKKKFARDPRIKQLENQIEELKQKTPDVVGADGVVKSFRRPFPHPTRSGLVRVSTYGLVRHPETGRILLTIDKMDPAGVYSLPGGRYNPIHGRGKITGIKIKTFEAGFADQVLSETAVKLGDIKLLDTYLGKVNPHSMSGIRIFLSKAAKGTKTELTKADLNQYQPKGKTELVEALWWDGKTEIEVRPAVYDILRRVAKKYGLDMSKVKIDKSDPLLLKARDKEFGTRTEPVDLAKIKNLNETEIKALRAAKAELLRKTAPGFVDWLMAEPDLVTLAELINGRRRAVSILKDGKITPREMESLAEHPELLSDKAVELLEKSKTKELTKAEIDTLSREIQRSFDRELAKLKDVYDQVESAAYRENGELLRQRYVSLLDKAVRAAGGLRRADLESELPRYEVMPAPLVTESYIRALGGRKSSTFRAVPLRETPGRETPGRTTPIRKTPERTTTGRTTPGRETPGRTTPTPITSIRIPPPRIPPPMTPPREAPPPSPSYKVDTEEKRQEFAGAITWRQGALGRKNPKSVWWAVKAPYSRREDVGLFIGEPPPDAQIVEGGVESAYRSIQTITGKAPEKLKIDLGIQDAIIRDPTKKPGKPGSIEFVRDVEQKTTGDITIGPRRPKVTKSTVTETLDVSSALGSSKMPANVAAAIGSYKGKITPEGRVVVKVRRL